MTIYKSLTLVVTTMINTKEENKRQGNNIKEGTNKFLNNQRQQLENTTSTISETTNRFNENVNEYQRSNNEIVEKSIDTAKTDINKKLSIQCNQSQTIM